ncbi:Ribonuclease P protein subunit p20 [Gryllus bimaculatus]|nr:Ribonuclease P protein subunit p20 [Gryllus bimaculatus]
MNGVISSNNFQMADSEAGGAKPDSFIKKRKPSSDYALKKRVPHRNSHRKNDVYVTSKSTSQSQLALCEKLFDSGESEIFIYGLGSAVCPAINIALQLKEKYPRVYEVSVETSTVDIVDDLEPLVDQVDYETQTRQNSAVRIRVYRIQPETAKS